MSGILASCRYLSVLGLQTFSNHHHSYASTIPTRSCLHTSTTPTRSRLLHTSPSTCHMELRDVVRKLEKVAPTSWSESWDNVGLLVEPSPSQIISRLIVTNDLTEEVMSEITQRWSPLDQCLVVSYHPPIFKPLKRLTQASSVERVLLQVLRAGMAVYSPHTALDNSPGGMTDWLLSGLGEGAVVALSINKHSVSLSDRVEVKGLKEGDMVDLLKVLEDCSGLGIVSTSEMCEGLVVPCNKKSLGPILSVLGKAYPTHHISLTSTSETTPTLAGGKQLTLKEPVRLSEIVQRVKVHLQLPFVRVASPQFQEDPIIKTVAACPGSGGSVLEKVGVDLLLTGEMSHHQVLAATGRGVAVLLCEHSNTERGYLQTLYKSKLEQVFADSVHVVIPKLDHDPLQIV